MWVTIYFNPNVYRMEGNELLSRKSVWRRVRHRAATMWWKNIFDPTANHCKNYTDRGSRILTMILCRWIKDDVSSPNVSSYKHFTALIHSNRSKAFKVEYLPIARIIWIDSNVEITICFTWIWARWERGWPTIELKEIDFCIDAEHKVKQKE